jgi:hypothetical protein
MANKAASKAKNTRAEKDAPGAEDVPVAEYAPGSEETPGAEYALGSEETPGAEYAPVAEYSPGAEEAPGGETAPVGAGFIDRLVSDPAHLPDVVLLLGYPGASSLAGHTRLYFAADLADYYEIPTAAILNSEDAPNFPGPSGAAYLWVHRHAQIVRKGRYVPDIKARFFSGNIMNDYLAQI